MAKKVKRVSTVKVALFVFALFLFVIGFFIGKFVQDKPTESLPYEEPVTLAYEPLQFAKDASIATIQIPAVDKQGNSLVTQVRVAAMPGSGKTLVDIDNLFYWVDTQNSIRMAKAVAEDYTHLDLDKYDLVFDVDANASLIGGPSAGAAIALATISALEKKPLKEDVMITGSINHDGSIGPVGDITAKAEAARKAGATMFLVPLLQSEEITYETNKHCEKFGLAEFCNVEQIPVRVDVASQTGINVKEVSSLKEALVYFYADNKV